MNYLFSLLVLCFLANIFGQNVYSRKNKVVIDGYQFEDNPTEDFLSPASLRVWLRIIRNDGSQFHGLMGKRSTAKAQVTRKRQRFQSFVGLMGKRDINDRIPRLAPCDLSV